MFRFTSVMFAVATSALLLTAFGKPERSNAASAVQVAQDNGHALARTEGPVMFLAGAFVAKSQVVIHGLPSFGAVLAGAVLVMPFGYSAYRTLRRKHSL